MDWSHTKRALLRIIYKQLTGDHSISTNEHEAKTDKRVLQLIEMEDPDIVVDLHKHNEGKNSQYDAFWDEHWKYFQETIGTGHFALTRSRRSFADMAWAKWVT